MHDIGQHIHFGILIVMFITICISTAIGYKSAADQITKLQELEYSRQLRYETLMRRIDLLETKIDNLK